MNERIATNKKAAADFIDLAAKCGATVHSAKILGSFFHIDTNEGCEAKIIEMLGVMRPASIRVLPKGADGRHLDGSKHHRIVATF